MTKPTGMPVGRPRRKIDHAELARLGGIGLTFSQAASVMRIPMRTLTDRIHEVDELKESFNRGRAQAIGQLSSILWDHARNGNVIAAIFLAKAYGWRDNGPVPDEQLKEPASRVIVLPAKDADPDL